MAEIEVERRSPAVWPWVVGLLVLALFIWALVEVLDGNGEDQGDPNAEVIDVTAPPGGARDTL